MQNNIVQSSLLQSYMQKAGINAQISPNNATRGYKPTVSLEQKPDVFQKENKEEDKKGKIAKFALLTSVGISVTAACIAAFRHKGGVVKTLKRNFSKLKDAVKKGGNETKKATKTPKISAENLADLQKGADNINNAKDSVIRHFFMKIPGYEKFDSWASKIYKNAAYKTLNKNYSNARNAISMADDAVLEAAKKGGADNVTFSRLKELIEKRQKSIQEFTSTDAIKGRIDRIDDGIQRLDDDAWQTIKGLKQGGFINGIKKLSKEALAEKRLKEAKKLQTELMMPFKNMGLTDSEAKEYIELVQKVTKGSSDEVNKLAINAAKKYKKAFTKENVDFFEKIRDINYGCAPGDIIGTLGTVGTLGLYTAQADTKEEKVGVTLTTGIPLVVSLGTTIGMTVKMVGGAKALILGGLTGLFANIIGKQVNNKYQESKGTKNAPKTIITFEDYANTAKEKAGNIIHSTEKTAY